ncbi:tRNA (adenosine(37)-N6)-dimethylallyltransferase MiaA [Mucilaginibacter sp. CSA2-8R]|uniref:tRNA (adenosine(37)-N6)-dimethylallyltransferase MiaA n=1 Tax=Mucilaginibacter sp. CSA2-8R TaxID=3141542 RepID=UPI00315DB5E2
MNTGQKYLISVVGATSVGKTAAAIQLANHYQTEIISADSRQFFREMSIGTAKPSAIELAQAPHHFINSHQVTNAFNVGDFEKQGLATLKHIFEKHSIAIMAGGSGLYVNAIINGFDELPPVRPEVREALNQLLATEGLQVLQQKLLKADPVYYQQVDLNNPQRLIRALEVYESTGKPYSSFRKGSLSKRDFNIVKIGLDLPREELYTRINQRVDTMLADGLIDEVKALTQYRHLNALNTVGYSEIFDYLDGKTDLATAVALVKQNTRRFAKRQLTWFKKDKDIHWFNPTNVSAIIDYIDTTVARLNA